MDPFEATVYLHTDSERQQFDCLVRAFEIFRERSKMRGDLWTQFTETDATFHIGSKLARLNQALRLIEEGKRGKQELEESLVDDALDIVNYAVFLVRHVEKLYPETDTVIHHG
jgi:hypothetical protein